MFTDALLRVSDSQDMAVAAGTIESDSSIDLADVSVDVLSPEIGQGNQLQASVSFPVALNNLTSMQIEIVVAASADLATTPVVIGSTDVLTLAQILAAVELGPINIRMNQNPELVDVTAATHRYLGVRYITLGTTPSGSTVTCDFVECAQGKNIAYPSRFTVL